MATPDEEAYLRMFPRSGFSDIAQNVFGQVPSSYEGLLGSGESRALQSRANTQGLLGAAIGLLGGMGTRGTTAAQNIAGALGSGMNASQGAINQGLSNFQMQQKMAQSKIAIDQAAALRASVAKVMATPEVAGNPSLVALLQADPVKGLEWINENMAVGRAYQPAPAAAPVSSGVPDSANVTTYAVPPSPSIGGDTVLPPVNVIASGNPTSAERAMLVAVNARLTGLTSKKAMDSIELNLKRIKSIDDQSNIDYERQRKASDYTQPARLVAAGMFPGVQLEDLNSTQAGQLQAQLVTNDLNSKKAGATRVDVNTGKAFGTEFGKGVADSVGNTFAAAQGAQSTMSAIQSIRPLIQSGVYAGPLSSVPRVVDQLATSLGITGGNDSEKLSRTAVAMQGLASLELSAAQAMKGQGAVTENERGLIQRAAAGNLQTFTQPEVLSLLNALEKTSQFKLKAHEKNLGRLRNRPDTADLADFYSLEQQAPAPTSSGVRKYNPATGRIE